MSALAILLFSMSPIGVMGLLLGIAKYEQALSRPGRLTTFSPESRSTPGRRTVPDAGTSTESVGAAFLAVGAPKA